MPLVTRRPRRGWVVRIALSAGLLALLLSSGRAKEPPEVSADFGTTVRPLLTKYCLDCHSTKAKKGSLDLERFAGVTDIRKDLKPWQQLIEQMEAGEMPPKDKPQPTAAEKKKLLAWTREFLDAEARSRTGDPGHVPLRRLSNAEYDSTVRDLTGVDLRPTREFPADSAGGEGFTNAAEALTDISPALLTKYLNAAKDIADHAVLMPDGIRFSPAKTRRDWTIEATDRLRKFYTQYAPADGRLIVTPYLWATVRHRDGLKAGQVNEVAAKDKLNAKYLAAVWAVLTDPTPSHPLDAIRAKWRTSNEKEVPAIAAAIAGYQQSLWKTVRVGSYMQSTPGGYAESPSRQVPVDPPAVASVPLRVAVKPTPGQSEVVVRLAAQELATATGNVVWHRPRFEGAGRPLLLLRDYPQFGAAFEIEYPTAFNGARKYLAAAVVIANDKTLSVTDVAEKQGLDAAFLKRWVEVLGVDPLKPDGGPKTTPAVPLTRLEEKSPKNAQWPALSGWRKKGTDLPAVVSNSSDARLQIPGRVVAHGVSMHPLPKEFVAVVWKSPTAGEVKVSAKIAHAHPACGNGVAWWLEHRRSGRATDLGSGGIDLGKEVKPPAVTVTVEKGDEIVLAVDAKNSDHVCDMTEITFAVTETAKDGRVWDLAADVADTIQAGNPHADRYKNADTWTFARGATKGASGQPALIPPASILGRWRTAASDPARTGEVAKLAEQAQSLLTGPRPKDDGPDRATYDTLVAVDGPLFTGVDVTKLVKPTKGLKYGLPKERFDDAGSIAAASDAVTEIKLPVALFAGREFVVDAKLPDGSADRVVRVQADGKWNVAVLASPAGAGFQKLLAGYAEFRMVFPLFTCFPHVVPTDEVVSLKMFHREDEPLERLFLSGVEKAKLELLWTEHRFVSRQAVLENDYLPQFIGFVTQDQPKAMELYFRSLMPAFQKRADDLLTDEEAAIPKHLAAVLDFADRAYRRPLRENEKTELKSLYQAIRAKGAGHDEAIRGVLTRVLISPAFLFRIESAPAGKEPGSVSDHELATRLSYFLWSSAPDAELRKLAAEGKLRDPKVLAAQAQRMMQDEKLRALATEFGAQWLHVRNFDEFNEKNEKLFPTFDKKRRADMNEEAIRFFQDLFQNDRKVLDVLDADHTFLNESLAKHYGIPGVSGPQWRQVDGVRKYGRGGILGFGSVQAKQAGASRTSPTLRGNWVVETLLGEKLPRPPKDVPKLPEEEGDGGLTTRQQVERHAKQESCAACHVRIDPFGFALEKYDAIGRLREKESSGLPVETTAKLKDGTTFEGIDGLREYLLTKKKDVIVRLFCKRLLGYALGRSVTLSDTSLLDEMVAELSKNDGRISAAVAVILRSPQFTKVRGSEGLE